MTRARLIANAGYVKPTAAAERISRDTVDRWAAGIYPPHVTAAQVEEHTSKARAEMAEAFSALAEKGTARALELLDDPKTSALQAATVAAIGIDKANLLTGHATERIEVQDLASFLSRSLASAAPTTTPSADDAPRTTASDARGALPN